MICMHCRDICLVQSSVSNILKFVIVYTKSPGKLILVLLTAVKVVYSWAIFFSVVPASSTSLIAMLSGVFDSLIWCGHPSFLTCPGVVRSPISATLPQVASRIFLVWGVLFSFPAQVRTPLPLCVARSLSSCVFILRTSFSSSLREEILLQNSIHVCILVPCIRMALIKQAREQCGKEYDQIQHRWSSS